MKNSWILLLLYLIGNPVACQSPKKNEMKKEQSKSATPVELPSKIVEMKLPNTEWKQKLDDQTYYVMRENGTERAFSGKYWDNHANGIYLCNACKLPLFKSDTKFESGTGWPSFYTPIRKDVVKEIEDDAYGMTRTEILCARCGGHLGHVFNDGPDPTGLRYCMNSAALNFVENGNVK
jgi:peptide-methionine (R)-S-oxide reductase